MADGQEYARLVAGDPAPWFALPLDDGTHFTFDRAAGRTILFCFLGSIDHPLSASACRFVQEHAALFDEQELAVFGISVDPRDAARRPSATYGLRTFIDADHIASRQYGAAPLGTGNPPCYRPQWIVLDAGLRVKAVIPFEPDGAERPALLAKLRELQGADRDMPVPVLLIPDVFEPDLCRRLIDYYDAAGGEDSGVMRELNGRTVKVIDHAHKRRADVMLEEQAEKQAIHRRIMRRVVPELRKVHYFEAKYIERNLIGCYDSRDGGHFRPHRDNTTAGTAHRRFAVSINLNEDFSGGELNFPEYGRRGFRAPAGAAIVFSCSLLHAVRPVEAGRRYAFLPFLYDEAAALIRERNLPLVDA